MRCRELRDSDIQTLRDIAAKNGFPYPELDHPHIEAVLVVVDSEDRPIMACAAKRLVELYLWVGPDPSPTIKLDALRLLHMDMPGILRNLGYTECNVQIPPEISDSFGRRLERTFGWVRNRWKLWGIRL